jgi:hypothetical protein
MNQHSRLKNHVRGPELSLKTGNRKIEAHLHVQGRWFP